MCSSICGHVGGGFNACCKVPTHKYKDSDMHINTEIYRHTDSDCRLGKYVADTSTENRPDRN